MLGIGKIASGGDAYYVEAVARGAEEYYRGVGEAPGQWTGAAAVELGLAGEVDPADLRAVWNGLDPQTGTKLGAFPNRTVHVFDLTFKAPKSVSVIYGLGDPEVSRAVRDAHDAAVTAAVAYVERSAVRSRCGKGGLEAMPVTGLVAAGFRHRTSRAGDPHLHTHVLAANVAHGVDGKWRTLDGRALYGQTNHLYAVATPDDPPTIEHGRQPPKVDDPIDLVRAALHREHSKSLAIDTGTPTERRTLDQLIAERDRLRTVLEACPPDRTLELRSLQAKQRHLRAELDPLERQRDELARKRLRGPRTRAELVALDHDIDSRTVELTDTNHDVQYLELNAAVRRRYIHAHRPDADRWAAINQLIEERQPPSVGQSLVTRVWPAPTQGIDGFGL
jgi:hypothetical protein